VGVSYVDESRLLCLKTESEETVEMFESVCANEEHCIAERRPSRRDRSGNVYRRPGLRLECPVMP